MPNPTPAATQPTRGDAPGAATRVERFVGAVPNFMWQVLVAFRRNQGLLLAGAVAVAYYTLLSLVPLLILVLIALSHVVAPARLFTTLGEYLEFLVPGQGELVIAQLRTVLAHRETLSGLLLASLVFFSTAAFTVLENAMSVIQTVYGSFAAAIAVLLSVEVAAIFLLLGAQVIATYEERHPPNESRRGSAARTSRK